MVFIGRQVVVSTKEINENRSDKIQLLLRSALEKAYAEGQIDAINGDIRIKSINFGRYVWVKSPWDSGEKVIKDTLYRNENGVVEYGKIN